MLGVGTAVYDIPAEASLEKLPVHVMNVCPSCLPDVTGHRRIVATTDVYVSAGSAEMTE
jgi:hypothetical protein